MLLEIAVFNVEDALKANDLGADRLEVCENYTVGGVTCNETNLTTIRNKVNSPLFAIVRPRAGNFVYTNDEFSQMQETILLCKKLQFNGIVLGILKNDNSVDIKRTKTLVELANPLPVTFHRAFDKTPNFETALDDVIKTGCKRILTSGGAANAFEGKEAIKSLIEKASSKILIIPGGGIRSHHLIELQKFTNAQEFHSASITENNKLDEGELLAMKNKLLHKKALD